MAGHGAPGDTYYDLGSFTWPVTTRDPQAQLWFDRGMAWCYGFNHDEAIACFERTLEHDPGCAMAHWGIAYAIGPNYNKPWEDFDDDDLRQSIDLALSSIAAADGAAAGVTDVERALIGALAQRFPASADGPSDAGPDDFAAWNDAYADAMRAVHRDHHDDLNVCALFAEAVMNRTPWALWDLVTGEPATGAGTVEAVEVLETAFADLDAAGAGQHPGLLHMYIHLMEMSPHPERALKAGDTLVDLIPDAGHLVHMPTHIDVLCGHYQNVVARNHAAVVADRRYLEQAGPANFYTLYRCHNYHFKAYGAMFLGQYGPAADAAAGDDRHPARRAPRPRRHIAGRLAGGLRARHPARADPLREVAGDPRPAPPRRPRALLRDHRHDALRPGGGLRLHAAGGRGHRGAGGLPVPPGTGCPRAGCCSTTPASTSWPWPRP